MTTIFHTDFVVHEHEVVFWTIRIIMLIMLIMIIMIIVRVLVIVTTCTKSVEEGQETIFCAINRSAAFR